MPGKPAGKVAVVTGGASGIGLASLRLFAREGADLVVVDRDVTKLPEADCDGPGGPPLLLEGDDSSFTTGSCLMVDGGWRAG